MPLTSASVSHDNDDNFNSTTEFLLSRWSKWGGHDILVTCHIWHQSQVTCTNIGNGTIAFLKLRQLKQGVTWLLWSCNAIGIGVSKLGGRQHHQWNHCIPKVKMIRIRSFYDLLGHVTPLALELASCDTNGIVNGTTHSFSQDNWNEVLHSFFHHVTPLALASQHTNCIVNGTIAFNRSRGSKWGATWHFSHVTSYTLALVSCNTDSTVGGPLHSLGQDYENEVQHVFYGHFRHWYQHWHHMILVILSMALLHSLGQDNWIEVHQDFLVIWGHKHQCNITPTASSMAPLHFLGHDNQNEGHCDFLAIWHHYNQCQHHMTPTV